MKKILTLFSIALLAAVACDKQSAGPELRNPASSLSEGTPVTLHFSMGGSRPTTRGSMTDAPNIMPDSTLYVLVFNANSGALLEAVPATILKPGITDNTQWPSDYEEGHEMSEDDIVNTDFAATVSSGSAPRYLQFVVDPHVYEPTSGNDNETGLGFADKPIFVGDSETDVVAKLYNYGDSSKGFQNGKTSYWQRLYLPHGLNAYTYPGGKPTIGSGWTYTDDGDDDFENDFFIDANGMTVYFGDYVNGFGKKITDGTGYIASTEVANLLKHVPMVRNFVKIEVSQADGGNFVPAKAVLVNVPKAGFIAPYSAASGFVKYYLYGTEGLQQLTTVGTNGIKDTGYTAPVPNDEIYTDCPDESACISATDGVINLFMYERGVPTANPTQLLVYGSLNGTNRWLKIDITDDDGNYIPLFRDFTYEMKIGNITGTNGYGSRTDAFNNNSIGNPSSSPETATLTQVSDGKGVGIWVDFIDYASFDTEGETVRLRYKFWNDNDSSVGSDDVTLTVSHKTGTGAVKVSTLSGAAYSGSDTQDGQSGWYYVDVPLNPQGKAVMRSVVRVSGTTTNSEGKTVTLYRDVTFSVMPTQTMTVTMSKLESDDIGKTTTATITLPDGLGYGIFPLTIRIEAFNGTINPSDTDLPVVHGTSTFSALGSDNDLYRTKNYYWFNKTIDYAQYESGIREFTATFKTIYPSGNETTVLFTDPDGRFYPVTVALSKE